jgi:hypothetical protein
VTTDSAKSRKRYLQQNSSASCLIKFKLQNSSKPFKIKNILIFLDFLKIHLMNKDFINLFSKISDKKKHKYKFLKFSGPTRISPNKLQRRHVGSSILSAHVSVGLASHLAHFIWAKKMSNKLCKKQKIELTK